MLKRILFSLVVLGVSQMVWAASPAASPAVQLEKLLAKLQSLEGAFEQLTVDAKGQRMQEANGLMLLQKPGRFYWETLEPYPQLLVSNGEQLWVYDPDLEQVTLQQLDEQSASPAYILTGTGTNLAKHFQVSVKVNGARHIFTLLPLQDENLFEELILEFHNGQIASLQLTDSLNQKTRVDLSIQKFNQAVDASKFEFIPPAGVDLIQQ